jgi:hypothetical protein
MSENNNNKFYNSDTFPEWGLGVCLNVLTSRAKWQSDYIGLTQIEKYYQSFVDRPNG